MHRGFSVRIHREQHSLAELEGVIHQRRLIGHPTPRTAAKGAHDDFHVVLLKPVQTKRRGGVVKLAIGPQFRVPTFRGPGGNLRMKTLSIPDHRRQQPQHPPLLGFPFQGPANLVPRLRLHRHIAIGAILHPEPRIQQADEMINLRDRGHRALAPASRRGLLDADRRRQAADRIDIGPRQLLHELPRVGAHRLQKTALSLGEDHVKGQRAFATAAHARHHHHFSVRQIEREVLEIVLARPADRYRPRLGFRNHRCRRLHLD